MPAASRYVAAAARCDTLVYTLVRSARHSKVSVTTASPCGPNVVMCTACAPPSEPLRRVDATLSAPRPRPLPSVGPAPCSGGPARDHAQREAGTGPNARPGLEAGAIGWLQAYGAVAVGDGGTYPTVRSQDTRAGSIWRLGPAGAARPVIDCAGRAAGRVVATTDVALVSFRSWWTVERPQLVVLACALSGKPLTHFREAL